MNNSFLRLKVWKLHGYFLNCIENAIEWANPRSNPRRSLASKALHQVIPRVGCEVPACLAAGCEVPACLADATNALAASVSLEIQGIWFCRRIIEFDNALESMSDVHRPGTAFIDVAAAVSRCLSTLLSRSIFFICIYLYISLSIYLYLSIHLLIFIDLSIYVS
jgi:hypothetical protein